MFPHHYLTKPTHPEKKAKGKCVSHGCRRRHAKDRNRCETCKSRLYRLNHDAHYAYGNLRSSARKRRIKFLLTFEQFKAFCDATGYLEKRGKDPMSASIDRIRTSGPYEVGNIRILTYADNVSHKHENPY
jgi:hypothetical protein